MSKITSARRTVRSQPKLIGFSSPRKTRTQGGKINKSWLEVVKLSDLHLVASAGPGPCFAPNSSITSTIRPDTASADEVDVESAYSHQANSEVDVSLFAYFDSGVCGSCMQIDVNWTADLIGIGSQSGTISVYCFTQDDEFRIRTHASEIEESGSTENLSVGRGAAELPEGLGFTFNISAYKKDGMEAPAEAFITIYFAPGCL